MTLILKLIIIAALLVLNSCSWGYKASYGETYPAKKMSEIEVLRRFPQVPYKEIGEVRAEGGGFTTHTDLVRKLRKAAADLGADAVVLGAKGSGLATVGGNSATTSGSVNVSGNSAYYNEVTTYQTPTTFSYPTYDGIAIRYLKSDSKKSK